MRIFNYIAVLAVLSLVIVGCASTHGTSPKGLEIPIENAAIKLADDVKAGGYKNVGTAELKKWLDEGKKVTIISALPVEEDKAVWHSSWLTQRPPAQDGKRAYPGR